MLRPQSVEVVNARPEIGEVVAASGEFGRHGVARRHTHTIGDEHKGERVLGVVSLAYQVLDAAGGDGVAALRRWARTDRYQELIPFLPAGQPALAEADASSLDWCSAARGSRRF